MKAVFWSAKDNTDPGLDSLVRVKLSSVITSSQHEVRRGKLGWGIKKWHSRSSIQFPAVLLAAYYSLCFWSVMVLSAFSLPEQKEIAWNFSFFRLEGLVQCSFLIKESVSFLFFQGTLGRNYRTNNIANLLLTTTISDLSFKTTKNKISEHVFLFPLPLPQSYRLPETTIMWIILKGSMKIREKNICTCLVNVRQCQG